MDVVSSIKYSSERRGIAGTVDESRRGVVGLDRDLERVGMVGIGVFRIVITPIETAIIVIVRIETSPIAAITTGGDAPVPEIAQGIGTLARTEVSRG